MRRLIAERRLHYRTVRGLQIGTVFSITILIQEIFHIPRAGWTGFALLMIYAGFDNGTTILRAYNRFMGMIWGLIVGVIFWFIGRIDYRLLFIIISFTIYCAYFLAGQAYSVPTVFTVCTSVIGTGYFAPIHTDFNITDFLTDYFICTLLAFAIILAFEYLWFKPHRLMKLFIEDTQADIIKKLEVLIDLLHQDRIGRAEWFRACISYTESLFAMQALARNAEFIVSSRPIVSNKFDDFVVLNDQIFICLKSLYFATFTPKYSKYDYNHLYQKVHEDLEHLKGIFKFVQDTGYDTGGMHASVD